MCRIGDAFAWSSRLWHEGEAGVNHRSRKAPLGHDLHKSLSPLPIKTSPTIKTHSALFVISTTKW